MVSPLILTVVAIILIAVFIWLLIGERNGRSEADRFQADQPVKPAAANQNLDAEAQKLDTPVTPIPATAPAHMPAAAEPAVVLVEPEVPAPVEAIPVAPEHLVMAETEPQDRAIEIQPDDLEIIEGIGPKIAGVLYAAGVKTFTQLAALDVARITEILQAGGIRLADPHSWPEQARLAAAGDQAGLQALQNRLKGGRAVA